MMGRMARTFLRGALVAVQISVLAACGHADTPAVERPHVDVTPPPKPEVVASREEAEPLDPKRTPAERAFMQWGVLSVPSHFQVVDGGYDLVIHFHGGQALQEENFDRTRINALVVSVNLGIGSGPYSAMFGAPGSLETALGRIQTHLDKLGRAPGAKVRRIALAAWSAGFGAIGTMLDQPGVADRVDAVILADALHTNFIGDIRDKKINPAAIEPYEAFARRAMRGEKLFAMTHSAIGVDGYASTTETATQLLHDLGMEKKPPTFKWPEGMHALYEAHSGDAHVIGFDGGREPDHMLHVTQMYATTLPWLKWRWKKR